MNFVLSHLKHFGIQPSKQAQDFNALCQNNAYFVYYVFNGGREVGDEQLVGVLLQDHAYLQNLGWVCFGLLVPRYGSQKFLEGLPHRLPRLVLYLVVNIIDHLEPLDLDFHWFVNEIVVKTEEGLFNLVRDVSQL